MACTKCKVKCEATENVTDQSWKIQYINQQGGHARDDKGEAPSVVSQAREAEVAQSNNDAAKRPSGLSKLELFNQQWAHRQKEIFKLAGIKQNGGNRRDGGGAAAAAAAEVVIDEEKKNDTKIDAKEDDNKNIDRLSRESKQELSPEVRKAKHEKGLAELRALYLLNAGSVICKILLRMLWVIVVCLLANWTHSSLPPRHHLPVA